MAAIFDFTSLDFNQIKSSIKDYLRSNSNFTDYDFEGSNFSVLIDILAYNTYISSYNANMVANEVFLDSATLRENVVSLARNIGYLPRSKKSAKAIISFSVNVSDITNPAPLTVTLNSGIVALSPRASNNSGLTFCIPNSITVPVIISENQSVANFNEIEVYEGILVKEEFIVDSLNPNQKFILSNPNIDTSLIRVHVRDNSTTNVRTQFNHVDGFITLAKNNIFTIDGNSKIFYLQEVEDERYEIIFGDGNFGTALSSGNIIEVDYVITSGENGNAVSNFSFAGTLSSTNGSLITRGVSRIAVNQSSFSGGEIESVESIRKYAPKIYASQYRAVTKADYESILPQIYPELESVSAFGGEELTVPQYGKVFLSIKPKNGSYLSSLIKQNIKKKLKKYSVAGIVPEIVDLKYLYIEPSTRAYYNNTIQSDTQTLNTLITNNVVSYSKSDELNKFGARFKYSKFLNIIDDSSNAITSNITNIVMRRDLRAKLNTFAEYEICFGNRFHIKNTNGFNIKSSGFTIPGIVDTVYLSDVPNSDMIKGKIFLFRLLSPTQPQIIKSNIGTIDYIKGEILLNAINILSTVVKKGENLVEISVSPYSNDVIGLQDLYLVLDTNKFDLQMITDQIESGIDTSGTTYIVSPSYTNGIYTR
jgi:hypothetical protein